MIADRLELALTELGIPGPDTPAPVGNAVALIREALSEVWRLADETQKTVAVVTPLVEAMVEGQHKAIVFLVEQLNADDAYVAQQAASILLGPRPFVHISPEA